MKLLQDTLAADKRPAANTEIFKSSLAGSITLNMREHLMKIEIEKPKEPLDAAFNLSSNSDKFYLI